MTFEEWFEKEWGDFIKSDPIDSAVEELSRNAWKAAQEDMRERAAITAHSDMFGSPIAADNIRALPIEV